MTDRTVRLTTTAGQGYQTTSQDDQTGKTGAECRQRRNETMAVPDLQVAEPAPTPFPQLPAKAGMAAAETNADTVTTEAS